MTDSEVSRRVSSVIEKYMSVSGSDCPKLRSSTKLVRDTGLSSDDGVNLVLDLCNEFNITLPDDFTATVHDDGKRDRTLGELVSHIKALV